MAKKAEAALQEWKFERRSGGEVQHGGSRGISRFSNTQEEIEMVLDIKGKDSIVYVARKGKMRYSAPSLSHLFGKPQTDTMCSILQLF
jgi:hypothetical protein